MSPAARKVRLLSAAALLVGVGAAAWTGWGDVVWWAPILLAVAVVVAETAVVHLSFGRQRWTFSLTEGAIAAAFVYEPGAWTVAAVVAGVLVAQALRHQERLKVEFNVGQFAAGTALGAAFAHGLGGDIGGAIGGMGIFWLVNNLMVAWAMSVMSEQRLRTLLWASAPLAAVHSAGTSSIGLLAAWLAEHAPLGLLGLVVPLILLWLSYDEQTARAAEARLFAELARLQERASGRSVDVSAQVVLTAAARLFGGADVEMVLMTADGAAHYLGDEHGVTRRRVDPGVLDSGWVIRALGAGTITTGVDDGRPFCSAVLGGGDAPLAVLIARRPAGSTGFGRRESMLAAVLANQAESWLSVAELAQSRDSALAQAEAAEGAARALGDLGAHTAPALVVLRESAHRLARLAETQGPASVGEIVDELYSVERAVASLLGAIALAADPELAALDAAPTSQVAPPAPRAVTDWTTTGVLS
ncbi:MAG TPA: hypothetical protein VFT62_02725 [Mycobacteriales bacterium]|nr:hypothetical protein [Mycobacteriales bacterium]